MNHGLIIVPFTLALLLLPVTIPSVDAQQGKVADSYVRVNVEPAFQYATNEPVLIPVQVRAVRDGIPQGDRIQLHLLAADTRDEVQIPGGQAWLQAGVEPYPAITWINVGFLAPGLYNMILQATAGELSRDWFVEFDVVLPPHRYEAALEGVGGGEARFYFQAHDENDEFTVEIYRVGAGGRLVLEQFTGSNGTLDVPYVPGESVLIDVVGPNGWKNAENRHRDWNTGQVTHPAWEWRPDYTTIKNWQYQSNRETIIASSFLVASIGAYWWGRWRAKA